MKDNPGEISPVAALLAALSGVLGIGVISGVAISVAIGGPGALFWMMITGIMVTSLKIAEVTLSHKYRKVNQDGKVFGGPFYYMRDGLKQIGLGKLGRICASVYAALLVAAMMSGSIMFQANQAVTIIASEITSLSEHKNILSLLFAAMLATVIIGGVRRIAKVASAITPLMTFLYTVACLTIIIMHSDGMLATIRLIIQDAFSGSAIGGSFIGVLVAGVSRAVYCSEAGIGTTSILHAASKNHSAAQEGIISMLEPLATTLMCLITGLAIVITNAYNAPGVSCNGILITKSAFLAVSSYFPILLAIAVPLFAFSTVIALNYYGEMGWIYLFNQKSTVLYKVLFVMAVYIGGISREMLPLIQMGDYLYMALVIPNLIALYPLTAQLEQRIYNYRNNSI
ncbi:hypothetical protein RLOatenuis_2240 [Rickettsiales bacterium]|nr:hypothetical protein RLOatenuis_2240 [Rickettsiales bacterium]